MKIVQIANFVHETSGGMRTALNALQAQYVALGHEVVLVRPGIESLADESGEITNHMIRGPILPMTGGYRVIVGRRELKQLLRCLQPDVVELSDKSTLFWVPQWCKRSGIACVVFSHERTDLVINSLGWKRLPLIPVVRHFRKSLVTVIHNWYSIADVIVDEVRQWQLQSNPVEGQQRAHTSH